MGNALVTAALASAALSLVGPTCTRAEPAPDAAASASPPAPSAPVPPFASAPALSHPTPGKYGCTSSHFVATSGTYEYRPRGSIVVGADGSYAYFGLATPSRGTVALGPKGTWSFTGGTLAGGEATPIEGRPNRVLLVAPSLDTRWTCGKVD